MSSYTPIVLSVADDSLGFVFEQTESQQGSFFMVAKWSQWSDKRMIV